MCTSYKQANFSLSKFHIAIDSDLLKKNQPYFILEGRPPLSMIQFFSLSMNIYLGVNFQNRLVLL